LFSKIKILEESSNDLSKFTELEDKIKEIVKKTERKRTSSTRVSMRILKI